MANAREVAARALIQQETRRGYSNLVWNAALRRYPVEQRDAAFAAQLFYGVLERRNTLDFALSACSRQPPEKLQPPVRAILRCALYQLLYLPGVPPSAAVNEAVALTRALGCSRASGYVNGVLRGFLRQGGVLPPVQGSKAHQLSILGSCDEGLAELLIESYGAERAERFLQASFGQPPLYIRANSLRIDDEGLCRRLAEEGAAAVLDGPPAHCLRLSGAGAVEKLKAFTDGWFHVQDKSSQRCAALLAPRPGERVLDLCSAPGGKAFTLAQYMEDRGELIAQDLHPHRVELIRQGACRLGLGSLRPRVGDAARFDPALGQFDRVLCDLPCSGLGVLRRKPEIRYKTRQELQSLGEMQYKILENSANYLKVGGRLLYSTCTLNPAENEVLIARLLRESPALRPVTDPLLGGDFQRTFWPWDGDCDGFYMALLTRVSPTL